MPFIIALAQLLASSAPPTLASRSALSQAGGAGHGHGAPDVDPSAQNRLSWTEARTCINKVRPLSSATSACVDQAPAQRKTRGSSKLRGTSPLTVLRYHNDAGRPRGLAHEQDENTLGSAGTHEVLDQSLYLKHRQQPSALSLVARAHGDAQLMSIPKNP